MPEIVSPESKLYVKEEVEKAKKEIKEDIEKANSKAARTFTIVGAVLGILTGVGVYGLAANYVKTAIKDGLTTTAIIQLEDDARTIVREVKEIEKELRKTSEWVKEEDFVNLPVGTIIPSILEPSSFAKTVGDPDPSDFDPKISKWVLANGRKVSTDSKYYMFTRESRIPDLRGMFLRGMNEGRNDGEQDPDDRKPGEYQRDALKQHGHETDALKLKHWKKEDTRELGYTSKGGADYGRAIVKKVTGAKAADETRPKNVAVYFYIKIN